jgi:predicted CoA-substrate-specific enzyme activase
MITAGIDVGIEFVKAVVVKDGEIVGKALRESGGKDRPVSVEAAYKEALAAAGLDAKDVEKVYATGMGKYDAGFADKKIVEAVADAKAARRLYPGVKFVVDVGSNKTLVLPLGEGDKIRLVTENMKCGGGIGMFLDTMAYRLEMTLDELGSLDVDMDSSVTVNSGCRVFAELDALDLLTRDTPPKKVAGAVVKAMAGRCNAALNDKLVPTREDTVLIGGVTKNKAFVAALEALSGIRFVIPKEAEYAGAYGAALCAAG